MGSTRDNVFINVDNRMIYIHDYIDEDSMSKAAYNLMYILNEDDKNEKEQKSFTREPIKIYINSIGGHVEDMWSFVDIILNSRTPIYTYCTGYAHSCGLFIFLAGEKRYITKHTRMLCHQLQMGVRGEYQHIKESVVDFDNEWEDVKDYILERTNITEERIDEVKNCKLDWYIRGYDLLKLGVATDLIEKF